MTAATGFAWTKESLPRNELTDRYEPLQPFILQELAKRIEASIFLDIGANIGLYTVLIGSLDNIESVHAFEPAEDAYSALGRNVALNALVEKCALHRLGLSNVEGEATMNIVGARSGANALASTSIHGDKRIRESTRICIGTVDTMLQSAGARLVVKLDVEGHELEVLQGARALLQSNQGVIQVEIYESDGRSDDVSAFLNGLGWQRFFSAGPDHYFSNLPEMQTNRFVLEVIEGATAQLIAQRKQSGVAGPKRGIRRRVLPGIAVELSPSLSRWVKRFRNWR